MFIQTEATPNPATLKFLPGKVVLLEGTQDFRTKDDAQRRSPLASQLFEIDGVTGVFFGHDFITITKNEAEWNHIKPAILGTIMEHFVAGLPIMQSSGDAPSANAGDGEFYDPSDEHIVITIKELLETRIRPAVAQDGGDITFKGFRDGTVFLTMKGACAGCPSSTATLKHGIQNLLRHFVPEVLEVESI
jgi:Fe-S cluster biogenesis protein NfuA